MKKPVIVLAFSGGLDTSFCLVYLKETLGADVITATVDTGGFSKQELKIIAARAKALGAKSHHTLDGRAELFRRFALPLIQGNVLRGRVYPLSVAAERILQAEMVSRLALKTKASGVAHGSTGAGNDQFRFDGVFQVLLPGVMVHTPVRDLGWSRSQEVEYLAERKVAVPKKTAAYSVNAGMWGTTVGGKETHDPWKMVPDGVYPEGEKKNGSKEREIEIRFSNGTPVGLNGKRMAGIELVTNLTEIGRQFKLGRGIHLGDTIIGIKGRIAFEAAAPLLLIAAHQELEKLVLTRWQVFWKNHIADFYGQLLHEGLYFDPVMRDIEALIASSQKAVTGAARIRLRPGRFEVVGVKSPRSLAAAAAATYGETSRLWTGAEAAGFAKLHALPMTLAARAAEKI